MKNNFYMKISIIFILTSVYCSPNFFLQSQLLRKPYKKYKQLSVNNSDFVNFARFEFDSCKKIVLSEDGESTSNEIDYLKRLLIAKLIKKVTKEDSLFLESKKLQACVNIDYAKRYRNVELSEQNLELKIIAKIKREAFAGNYIEKAINILNEVILDTIDVETFCLLCSAYIEKSITYVNVGKYFAQAPIPKCLAMCECSDFRLLLLEKYNEALNMSIAQLDSFYIKYEKLRYFPADCLNDIEKFKIDYEIKNDSIANLIKIEKSLSCKSQSTE